MLSRILSNLNRKKLYVVFLVVFIPSVLTLFSAFLLSRAGIYNGIYIENMNISGMSLYEAYETVNGKVDAQLMNKLVLSYGDRKWEFSLKDFSFEFLSAESVEKAYRFGREGSILRRLSQITGLWIKKKVVPLNCRFDENNLREILENVKKDIDNKEESVRIKYEKDTITFEKEKHGHTLNIDKNINLVENQIKEKNFNIELDVDVINPSIVYDDVREIADVVSSFTTIFNSQDFNRTSNIKLACKKIDGRILLPGDTFSMNEALGPRTLENGYLEAGVIYKNELIKGPGGGICQVTTTLYDAVLLAKLSVIERSHHSLPLAYVEPGQDATIAENQLDFKFTNSQNYPVCISAGTLGNRLNIRILSRKNDEYIKVRLKSDVIKEIPPIGEDYVVDDTIPEGQIIQSREAKKGLKAVVYRETYGKDGNLITKEKISEDYYEPVKPQFKMNTQTHQRLTG